jgi:hypothetical protein
MPAAAAFYVLRTAFGPREHVDAIQVDSGRLLGRVDAMPKPGFRELSLFAMRAVPWPP